MTKEIADRRLAFDRVPEIYDRGRPGYPAALFDDLFGYLQPADGPTVAVEIGPGTGKATRPLLERGSMVTAVEIGPNLSRFLREKLAPEFPGQLEVINSAFEECELEAEHYDFVLAATAFHWIEPSTRVQRCRDLLRPGGTLALISTNQIASDADRGFFERVFPIYQRVRGEERRAVPSEDIVPSEYEEVDDSGLFVETKLHRYRWDQTYSSKAYADLVRTYSDTQMMEEDAREALIEELCGVIDNEYGGSVVRPLVITLTLGRRPGARRG